jgi:chemotaxis protein MotB
VQSANQALQTQLAQLKEHQQGLAKENEQLKADLVRIGKTAADAEWVKAQKEKLDELLKRHGEGSTGAITGVDVIQTSEGVAFRVLGGVLFASGKADITDQGKKTLQQLIATLKGEGKRIRVDGHTDDEPITHSSWGTNLRLSVERSLAVAAFLIQSGVPADRVGVAGFGEHRPTKQGSTEEARAANRRVEILMLDR